jgi:hypothetical protein
MTINRNNTNTSSKIGRESDFFPAGDGNVDGEELLMVTSTWTVLLKNPSVRITIRIAGPFW